MNNFRYNIFIQKLENRQNFIIDLLKEDYQSNLNQLSSFLNQQEQQFELEVNLGLGIGQLVEKKYLEPFYERIRYNLKFVINYIQNMASFQMISTLTFKSFDCLFNVDDILLHFVKDFKQLNNLAIYQKKEFSIDFFNQLLSAICLNRESLNKLTLVFNLQDDQAKIEIPQQLKQIQHLCLSDLTQQKLLDVFKIAKEITRVDISYNLNSNVRMNKIVEELQVLKNCLQNIQLQIDMNQLLQYKDCLKGIEKLENLRTFALKTSNLKNQNLDIQKLKKLEKLSLNFSDAIDYVSKYPNLNQLIELKICIGSYDANELILKSLKNLRILKLKVQQVLGTETKKTISCLEKFSEIAHQLDDLQIDFSESNYFCNNQMNSKVIASFGHLFEKCDEKTVIHLITKNCIFNMEKRFEIAMQLKKVKNYQEFILNDACLFRYQQNSNVISFGRLKEKFPYYLSIFSNCQNKENYVIEFRSDILENSYQILKKYEILFSNFKGFQITYIQENNQLKISENFLDLISEETVFLSVPQNFQHKSLINHSKQLTMLQKIEFEEISVDTFIQHIEPNQLKKHFNNNLHLIFTNFCAQYKNSKQNYQQIFDIEGYIIEMTIKSHFLFKHFPELFQLILNKKNIIYLRLLADNAYYGDDDDDKVKYSQKLKFQHRKLITNYSQSIKLQVLTISSFNKYFLEDIKLNPKLVYLDLYF